MNDITDTATSVLATLTLIGDIVLVIVLALVIWHVSRSTLNKFYKTAIAQNIKKYSLHISFFISLTATLGSLFYSEIAGFAPCKLCWFQRVFMYPLPMLFGLALYKKDKNITDYGIGLSLIGSVIAAYHYALQINPNPFASCSTIGFSASCSDRFVTHFGYITIPMMSLTAFLLILSTLVTYKYSSRKAD